MHGWTEIGRFSRHLGANVALSIVGDFVVARRVADSMVGVFFVQDTGRKPPTTITREDLRLVLFSTEVKKLRDLLKLIGEPVPGES